MLFVNLECCKCFRGRLYILFVVTDGRRSSLSGSSPSGVSESLPTNGTALVKCTQNLADGLLVILEALNILSARD